MSVLKWSNLCHTFSSINTHFKLHNQSLSMWHLGAVFRWIKRMHYMHIFVCAISLPHQFPFDLAWVCRAQSPPIGRLIISNKKKYFYFEVALQLSVKGGTTQLSIKSQIGLPRFRARCTLKRNWLQHWFAIYVREKISEAIQVLWFFNRICSWCPRVPSGGAKWKSLWLLE